MTDTITLSRPGGAPRWLRAAVGSAGARVRVDGAVTLALGDAAEPAYRVDVRGEDCRVDLSCDGQHLTLRCLPHAVGHPLAPGARFGWTVEAVAGGELVWLPARPVHALTAVLRERDAAEAVRDITRWVSAEARLRAASAGRAHSSAGRRAAGAWRCAASSLERALEGAERLRLVPVRPLRDEFVWQCARGDLTAMELARRLGWHWDGGGSRGKGDTARVLRRLTLLPEPSERRMRAAGLSPAQRELQRRLSDATSCVTYDVGVAICRALRRDPADFGWL